MKFSAIDYVEIDPSNRILSTVVVTNRVDQGQAEDGLRPTANIRSVNLNHVRVSDQTRMLCLPAAIIRELGLDFLGEVEVDTTQGIKNLRMFQDAKISLCGREGTFECL